MSRFGAPLVKLHTRVSTPRNPATNGCISASGGGRSQILVVRVGGGGQFGGIIFPPEAIFFEVFDRKTCQKCIRNGTLWLLNLLNLQLRGVIS